MQLQNRKNNDKILNHICYAVYLVLPTLLLLIDSVISVLLIALFQMSLTIYLIFKYFGFPEYRNNPFILGSWIFFTYLGFAPLITFYNIQIVAIDWRTWIIESGFNNENIVKAQLILNFFGIILLFVGKYLIPHFQLLQRDIINKLSTTKNSYTAFSIVLSIIQIYFFFSGNIALGGISENAVKETINPVLSFLFPLFFILPFLGGYYVKKNGLLKLLWVLILLIQVIWFLFLNKRAMLFAGYIFFVNFYSFERLTFNWKKLFLITIIVISFLGLSSIFQKLRMIGLTDIINQKERSTLLDIYNKTQTLENLYVKNQSNQYVAQRFFSTYIPLARFGYLFEYKEISAIGGIEIINSFKNATPGNFFFNKKKILINEELYNHYYSQYLYYYDIGNTIVLQGFVAFRYVGVVLYISLYLFLIFISYKYMVKSLNNGFLNVVFFSQLSYLLINSYEQSFSDIWICLRTILAWFIVIVIFGKK